MLGKGPLFHAKRVSEAGHVSRETAFHGMNLEILLTYAKLIEDDIQNILDIDPAK
jgi:hypothetical protein